MSRAITQHSIPYCANAAICITLVALHALILFALPTLLPHAHAWLLIFMPMAWLNIVHWGLIHEAIHKILFSAPRVNELMGRTLAILMGPSFQVLRFGHLMHHKLNRDWHAEPNANADWRTQVKYYFHLLFGLYLSELTTGWMLAILPHRIFMRTARASFLKEYEQVAVAGERFFYEKNNIRSLRVDAFLSTLLYAIAFYAYGAQWPYLVTFLIIRAVVISFMDNIYHYATPRDNSKPGKELALPSLASLLLLHGNYHETHHTNPNVPWAELPKIHAAQGRRFDGKFIDHGWMQFAGPSLT